MKKKTTKATRQKQNRNSKIDISGVIENAKGVASSVKSVMSNIASTALPVLEFEKSKGGLSASGISDKGINLIADEAKKFTSKVAGVTAVDFMNVSKDIKSGVTSITDESIADLTKLVSLTATATKTSMSDMTKLFVNSYQKCRKQFSSDDEFGKFFSNSFASAVQVFGSVAPSLVQGLSDISDTATNMGVSFGEQLSVVGLSRGAFNSAGEAVDGYREFLEGVGSAEDELGLKFTDAKGKLLPMVDILTEIKMRYGELADDDLKAVLENAFGSKKASESITSLIGNIDELNEVNKRISADIQGGNIAESMAMQMNRGNELELAKQSLNLLSIQIGEILLPKLSGLIELFRSGVDWLREFTKQHPALVEGIALVGGSVYALITAYDVFTKIINIAQIAQTAFNLAALANPTTWVIAGIVAAVAGLLYIGYQIYENWDYIVDRIRYYCEMIKAYVSVGWNFIKDTFLNSVDFIKNLISKAIDIWLLPFKLILVAIRKVKKALGMDTDGETSFTAEIKNAYNVDDIKGNIAKSGEIVNNAKSNLASAPTTAYNQYFLSKYNGDAGLVNSSNNATKRVIQNSPMQKLMAVAESKREAEGKSANNLTYSPIINIGGNADKAVVEEALRAGKEDFSKSYKDMQESQLRLGY